MGKPSAPSASSLVSAQNQASQYAAQMNSDYSKYDSTNPYGSTSWSQTGTNADGTPIYTQNTSLSPVEQNIFNSQTGNQQSALNSGGLVLSNWAANGGTNFNPQLNPLSYSAGAPAQATLGNYTTSVGNGGTPVQLGLNGPNPTQLANESANAAYQNQMGYLTPQYQEQQSDLNSQLAAQGITQGSDAWNRAQGDLNRNQTFGQQQAESSAFNQGLSAENNLYGQELSTGGFDNAAQGQQYNQAMGNAGLQNQQAAASTALSEFNAGQQNNMAQFNSSLNNSAVGANLANDISTANEPLQEYGALTNGSMPSLPTSSTLGTPVAQSNVGSLLNSNYQNQVGAYNGTMQGAASLLSMGMNGSGNGQGGTNPTMLSSLLNGFGNMFGGIGNMFGGGSAAGADAATGASSSAIGGAAGDVSALDMGGGMDGLASLAGDGMGEEGLGSLADILGSLFTSGAGEEAVASLA